MDTKPSVSLTAREDRFWSSPWAYATLVVILVILIGELTWIVP